MLCSQTPLASYSTFCVWIVSTYYRFNRVGLDPWNLWMYLWNIEPLDASRVFGFERKGTHLQSRRGSKLNLTVTKGSS